MTDIPHAAEEEPTMTHRVRTAPRIQSTMLSAVLLVGVLALFARPAVGQGIFKLGVSERMDPGPAFPTQGFLTVSHDGERAVEVVLLAHRIEDDRIVDTHRSSPFKVAAERPYPLDERQLPPQRFYNGTLTGEVVTTREPVSLVSAEGGRTRDGFWADLQERADITTWSNVKSFQEWKPRDGVVFIVLPTNDRLRRDATGYPVLVFTEGASR